MAQQHADAVIVQRSTRPDGNLAVRHRFAFMSVTNSSRSQGLMSYSRSRDITGAPALRDRI
jgi:hypothetical protein